MRRLPTLLLLAGLILLSACVARDVDLPPYPLEAPPATATGPGAPPTGSFVLGVGDTLNIAVWRFDDLKRTVLVDPSGNIQFPFAGEVRAAGRTLEQLRAELETRLAAHYVQPKVDISVATVRSNTVHVLGEVKTPGTLTMETRVTAVDAIARAGGFTTDADEEAVMLIRDQEPEAKIYLLSLNLRGAKTSRHRFVPLKANDIVYVPPTMIVDWTRFMTSLVGVLNPLITLGRDVIVADQVKKVLQNKSEGVLVAP